MWGGHSCPPPLILDPPESLAFNGKQATKTTSLKPQSSRRKAAENTEQLWSNFSASSARCPPRSRRLRAFDVQDRRLSFESVFTSPPAAHTPSACPILHQRKIAPTA